MSNQTFIWSCEMDSSKTIIKNRINKQNRMRRSIIRERFVETLLVADASVSEFFSHSHVAELYLLTMMNMVHGIYKHVSLGYPVEIVLTHIIMLNNKVRIINMILLYCFFMNGELVVGFSNGIKIT